MTFADPTLVTEADRPREPRARNIFIDDEAVTTGYGVALCPLCGKPSLVTFSAMINVLKDIKVAIASGQSLGGGAIEDVQLFPSPPPRDDHASWPPRVAKLFADAQHNQTERRSPALVIAACRSILDVAIKALGGSGHDLKTRIEDLRVKGDLTQGLADWAHALRLDGNEAIHEIEGSREEADELLSFVRLFLHVTFILPAEIAQRRAVTPLRR